MPQNRTAQQGVIFLALVLVLFVTGGTLVLGAINNRQTTNIAEQAEVHYQMEQAKAALLAYAASSAELNANARGPGFFPCPDIDYDGDGEADATCDSDEPLVGRLPEFEDFSGTQFRFNDTYADVDRQFWYVVAPRYVYYSDDMVSTNRRSYFRIASNFASPYWLTLDGQSEYVAFIIAPGDELSTQNRASGPTDYANYLDGQNGASIFDYYTSYSSNPELFNDQIIGITLDEYMVMVGSVVAREVKKEIDLYNDANGSYPPDSYNSIYPPVGGNMSNPSTSCATNTTFSNTFDNGYIWGMDTSTGTNGERWSCTYSIYWNRDTWPATDSGELKFNYCPGLSYRLEYGGDVVRTGTGC